MQIIVCTAARRGDVVLVHSGGQHQDINIVGGPGFTDAPDETRLADIRGDAVRDDKADAFRLQKLNGVFTVLCGENLVTVLFQDLLDGRAFFQIFVEDKDPHKKQPPATIITLRRVAPSI